MWSRREFGSAVAGVATGNISPASAAQVHAIDLSAIPLSDHEAAMRLAIQAAQGNPVYPFGAVIVRSADRQVLATGVNKGADNPTFHGEIVAINDYVLRHGNSGWGEAILYTTGEPCPMCMSAMVWAGMGGVVWGTSIEKLREVGINQILFPATTVIRAGAFYHGVVLGALLQAETDALFVNRKRA
jgi:tRNA(adenine34) deaminase